MDFPSVGATENSLAASTVPGTTIIQCCREPESDLQNFLNRMGARIKGAGGFHSIVGVSKFGV